MLKELIHEKINEVFAEYQKANNIISGDIEPFDAQQLELAEGILAEIIERVCEDQPRETTKLYKITYTETLVHWFYVDAVNEQQAQEIFEQKLANGEFDFSHGDVDDTDFKIEECEIEMHEDDNGTHYVWKDSDHADLLMEQQEQM